MFKLALQLGCTVNKLSHRLDYDEYIEWMAYDSIDPFGGFRSDLQTAHIVYAQCGGGDAKLSDFLPIDPNPMTDEMREQYEYEQAIKDSEQEARQLAEMFDRLEARQG
ncbi:Protein of unknown function [Moraxella cuniculi DSM 21768]|uniref:Minor tail T domain-containing protein n=1 Tax=Moraxella cuniculi DSM 21768 TaxID=1122245 RepID=A0A1N7G7R3_9GAMM|nr:DUF4035 domain-containing protein [Moraxella cuniculi]SIS08446.1 Protein of unknown function [Moraxella cuniculi DSM 21768]